MTLAPLRPETRNLIDGQLVPASNGGSFENLNPATEEVLGSCADGTKDDVLAAIGAARRAFDETSWSTDSSLRRRCLLQLADALKEAREELRAIVVHEAGSPVLLETISAPYTATVSDAYGGTTRFRLAWEGTIRASISRFLDKLREPGAG